MAIPLINGRTYDYASIIVNIMSVPVAGIPAIEYSDEQEIEDNYGAGTMPVNRGFGKYKATAKLTLFMEEVEAITALAINGRLQDIPEFDIIVAYVNSGNVPVTHKLRNCRFKSNNRKAKSGDTKIEVELDLIVSHITW